MPVTLIKDETDFNIALESTKFGTVVIVVYDSLSPVFMSSLKLTYEFVSRESKVENRFYYVDLNNLKEETTEKYNIFSYPQFLLFKNKKLIDSFQTSTKHGLVKMMKIFKLIDKDAKIDLTL